MTQEQFYIKFFTDMHESYNIMFAENGICQFSHKTSDLIHIDFFSKEYIYQQYQVFNSYNDFKKNIVETLEAVMGEYQFHIIEGNIMPLVKPRHFSVSGINFVRDEVKNTDLDFLYVQDTGNVYKFISEEDLKRDGIESEELKKRAWSNLNKITMPLLKLEEDIFSICGFDNAATVVFLRNAQSRIERKLKTKDWIFSIPSSSNLLIAKFSYFNVSLLKSLQEAADSDINKITNTIYRMKDGVLSTVNLDKRDVKQKANLSLLKD